MQGGSRCRPGGPQMEPRSCHVGATPRRMKTAAGCHGLAAQRSGHAASSSLEPLPLLATPITPLRFVLGRATLVCFHRRHRDTEKVQASPERELRDGALALQGSICVDRHSHCWTKPAVAPDDGACFHRKDDGWLGSSRRRAPSRTYENRTTETRNRQRVAVAGSSNARAVGCVTAPPGLDRQHQQPLHEPDRP
ncbi:hypothetical protein Mal4_04150 [Maioricimonas rarisocia]|uniref:Uncharacterized protein n=1 Tax=Maioricimonas rarisocia TaxID=2528026 RepID=A0A517Z0X8_9PLAN|nr:hypothetical protein Mal4_04150 [Maioricimonas rarisocia]